jgi:hypothetical protein
MTCEYEQPIHGTWRDDPAHFQRPTRRGFLQIGMIGGLGLTLGDFFRMQAASGAQKFYATREGAAKSVIHIFLPGGMSAQETFDPKPYAPVEYRGPVGSIDTVIPGVKFGDPLPDTAKIADKITVIRSMAHGEAAHDRGTHNMFTGYRPSPAVSFPSFGSVVSHEFGPRKNLPPYVCIPGQPNEFAGSGYLSSAYGPFSLGSEPEAADFKVRDLALPEGVTDEHFTNRRTMLEAVDGHFRLLENSDKLDAMDTFYNRAYALISSKQAREAFNIGAEPGELRDRYGRNAAGQRMLLARRLAEAGVRFISLTYGSWDHHGGIAGIRGPAREFDKAFAALVCDLDERGLLDSTLVMVTTEFGRSPRINKDGGRDHWPRVFSIALAGGGVKRGLIYGRSDATSSAVADAPVTVENLATTVYNQLGINADKELMAPGDRPIEIVKGGRVIRELLA